MNEKKIRVLVVDDSNYMRFLLAKIMSEEPDIEVVDKARDGLQALEMLEKHKPDVVTLDVEMPRMDGLETLRRIFELRPTPVVMVSRYTQSGGDIAIRALELGAVDVVQKPEGREAITMGTVRDELVSRVRTAAAIHLNSNAAHAETGEPRALSAPRAAEMKKVVVIGCSTGGPRALAHIMPQFPADAPIGIIIVQHMPAGFTLSLSRRLDQISPIAVSEALEGECISSGRALVAPGDFHARLLKEGRIVLSSEKAVNNVRPSVDVTMKDAAFVFGKNVIGVVLTGMGCDGMEGCAAIKAKGGTVIAQSTDSCVVDGMPGAVIRAGHADRVAPLDDIPREILSLI